MVTVGPMNTPSGARLSLKTIFLLTLPPLLWSGNAVVGRMVAPLISPMTLNVLRWTLALLVLLYLAWWRLIGANSRRLDQALQDLEKSVALVYTGNYELDEKEIHAKQFTVTQRTANLMD